MKIGDHFRVEGLVRLAEGRMFYLLNDDRPENTTRKCFDCGHAATPREDEACTRCGASLADRKFLMSVRWDPKYFGPFTEFCNKGITHPGLVLPIDVFVHEGLLCSVAPYRGESLLLDECSPLPAEELIRFWCRTIGLAAFLHQNGIELYRLNAANFLIDADGNVVLFDLDVKAVHPGALDATARATAVDQLARILRRYVPVHLEGLWNLVAEAESEVFKDTESLGRAFMALLPTVETAPPPPTVSALSDVGLIRDLNEDNWSWTRLAPDVYLYVVADGMGGHDSGEVASELASRTLCQVARDRARGGKALSPEFLENVLDEAFQTANNTVKEAAENRGNDMGTTLVALLVVKGRLALIANVGDSRGYLLRDKTLHKVTRDHSLVQRMVEQNRITEEEARNHPHSNILLRTVGTERNVEIDIYAVEVEKGDRVLLCSDGLWGEVEDEDIEAILNHYQDLRTASRELIRAAHHGGGRDNVTLILVENS